MKFRSVIDSPGGLRYIYDKLDLRSAPARKTLLDAEMMVRAEDIRGEYEKLSEFFDKFIRNGDMTHARTLQAKLGRLKDISGTLARLESGITPDDVELFEIKSLAILSGEIAEVLDSAGINTVRIPDLSEPLAILDPEGQKVPSFYVYDCYDEELRQIRKEIKKNTEDRETLIGKSLAMEVRVRQKLADTLRQYVPMLRNGLEIITATDILLAKAVQIKELGLVFPELPDENGGRRKTVYKKMFHPQIREVLSVTGKEFQPVDITIGRGPVTIIGANMGGKSVVLKMLALNQYLFQFGFGVAAGYAAPEIKENVLFCIGEEQDPVKGLSSFASEVLRINEIIVSAKSGSLDLALIDEPARTTNPVEGTALASALLEVLAKYDSDVVLTTHYNLENTPGRKLRVKGLVNGVMDYALEETADSVVPREAVTIAESLGADPEWLAAAEEILNRKNIQD